MTAFAASLSLENTHSADGMRAVFASPRLAYDPVLETGSAPGVSWSAARRPNSPEHRPWASSDDGSDVLFVVFGTVFTIDGRPTLALDLHEREQQIRSLYRDDAIHWATNLKGHFVIIVSDMKRQRITIVRDPLGAQPAYFRKTETGYLVANAARLLIDADNNRASPNQRLLAQSLVSDIVSGGGSGGVQTYFGEISRIPPQHMLVIDSAGAKLVRYFDAAALFLAPKFADPDPAVYRGLLKRVVREQAGDMKNIGVTLSGGLDSPAIALLLSSIGGPDYPLQTISFGDLGQGADESANVRSVLGEVKADPTWVHPVDSKMFDLFAQSIGYLECPIYSPSPPVFALLKQAVADKGIHAIFGGLAADEVMGGLNLGYLKDLFFSGSFIRFMQELNAYQEVDSLRLNKSRLSLFREHVFDPARAFRGGAHVPGWIRRDVADAFQLGIRDKSAVNIPGAKAFDAQTFNNILRTFTQSFLNYESHLAIAYGVENRFPYLDPEVVAYAARLPWHEKMAGGLYKIHHRKAFAGIFPETVGAQKKKSLIPAVHDQWLRVSVRGQVSEVMHEGNRWTEYLDRDAVLAEHRVYMETEDLNLRTRMRRSTWRAISLELFSRAFWP
jgi:asparagine synthase (glutamine-hydrolysing)